jgi:hypothetical protein
MTFDPVKAMFEKIATDPRTSPAFREGMQLGIKEYEAAKYKSALDSAWYRINAIGGSVETGDVYGRGYCAAVSAALKILEDVGAEDPLRKPTPLKVEE